MQFFVTFLSKNLAVFEKNWPTLAKVRLWKSKGRCYCNNHPVIEVVSSFLYRRRLTKTPLTSLITSLIFCIQSQVSFKDKTAKLLRVFLPSQSLNYSWQKILQASSSINRYHWHITDDLHEELRKLWEEGMSVKPEIAVKIWRWFRWNCLV